LSKNVFEGRDSRGFCYATRKFTYEEAQQIRLDYDTGTYTQEQIAIKYNVSQSLINKILRRKTYMKE